MNYHPHRPSKRGMLVIGLVSAVLAFGATQVVGSYRHNSTQDLLINFGLTPVSAAELRHQVVEYGVTAYWTGEEPGIQYLLNTSTPGQVSIKYLPPGVDHLDTRATLREIVTFTQKGAFANVRDHPKTPTTLSFINADGNSVYLDSASRFTIYVGIKGRDFQVSLFDPRPTRNLALVSEKGRLVPVS